MSLLQFREKIHTECDAVDNPVLNIQAIKIDGSVKSLKKSLGCARLKSCDYFKRKKAICYMIEVSDFNREIKRYISESYPLAEAKKYVKEGIRLKISETLLIYQKMVQQYNISSTKVTTTKVLLTSCEKSPSSSIALDFLSRDLERHYKPAFCHSIKVLPYTKLETYLNP